MTRPRYPATTSGLARRYLWWPLLLCAAWLAVVAVGPPWPAVLMGPPCVLMPYLVAVRGPFPRAPLAAASRAAAVLVPMLVVAVQHPQYAFGKGVGLFAQQPGVITASEVATEVARLEIPALLVVEVALLALAHRRRRA
ncbi:hypothetical protein LFM56_11895 [Cellulomonas iranensis]|uniref:hypothetical protein n=1 Tax=Cellulomonas iranensis TaxID=76862 RepID=UPI001CF1DEF5|nr:hypothetical protein [Cellulomonas iranensis]UCN13607.1 hypothetical protein LFM56_11895 [Cellulomonas iranensis]